jgi:hypothetical protein
METILQDEDLITVYDILGTLMEKIKDKCSYMLLHPRCPEDIRATLDTIIYASCRLNIDELHTFRNNIQIKYGVNYIEDASSNKSQLANINVVDKLRMKVPSEQILVSRIRQICQEFGVDFIFPQEIHFSGEPFQNNEIAFNPIYGKNDIIKPNFSGGYNSNNEFQQNQGFESVPNIGFGGNQGNQFIYSANNNNINNMSNISKTIHLNNSIEDPAQLNMIYRTHPNFSHNNFEEATVNLPSSNTIKLAENQNTQNNITPNTMKVNEAIEKTSTFKDEFPKTPQ